MSTTADSAITAGQIILIEKCNKNDNLVPYSEIEIKELFQEHKPFNKKKITVHQNSQEKLPCDKKNASATTTIAQLIFPTTEQAEMVFAMFDDDSRIQLRYDFSQSFLLCYNKNFATCYIQGVPINYYDLEIVYNAFRKFGPVYKCQRLTPPSEDVMIHYYSIKHRDQALDIMRNYSLPGDIKISVVCSLSLPTKSNNIKANSKKKRPVNLQLQYSTIYGKNSMVFPSSSPLTSPTILFMNASPSQHHYSPCYYIPVHHDQQQQQRQQRQTANTKLKQPNFEIKPSMDLCNLYIKGIQHGLTSTELFNLFKPFGRIISARMMEDNRGRSNPGFGFVSFSRSLEAAKALIEMHTNHQKKENEKTKTVMTVRFHEPRVPRPEHSYSQQLALLSNSPLGPHFYTRQENKIIPLQTMMDDEPPAMDSHNYTGAAIASPTMINNANPNSAISNYHTSYYYPSYWTDYHGVIYANVPIPSAHQPTSLYNTSSNNKMRHHKQCHSWSGNTTASNNNAAAAEANISEKLVELLKSEYNVMSKEEPELVKKLLKLNRIEQSNCLNNSVYFKKKLSILMTTNNDSASMNVQEE